MSTMGEATPAYIWNASKSVPVSLYQLQPVGRLAVTELVAVRPPEPLATFLDLNGYLPIGVPMLKRVLAAQAKSIDYLYDERNRAEAVRILVGVSGLKVEDVEKSYDFFRKNDFFDRTGKISRAKMNALLDALVGLGDLQARGNIERFLLPGVAQLSD